MSVLNEFYTKSLSCSAEDKVLSMTTQFGAKSIFKYTFMCKSSCIFLHDVSFFFDFKTAKVFITYYVNLPDPYKCWILGFAVVNDAPLLSAQLWDKDIFTDECKEDFKNKYAAYLLDGIINERV